MCVIKTQKFLFENFFNYILDESRHDKPGRPFYLRFAVVYLIIFTVSLGAYLLNRYREQNSADMERWRSLDESNVCFVSDEFVTMSFSTKIFSTTFVSLQYLVFFFFLYFTNINFNRGMRTDSAKLCLLTLLKICIFLVPLLMLYAIKYPRVNNDLFHIARSFVIANLLGFVMGFCILRVPGLLGMELFDKENTEPPEVITSLDVDKAEISI